MDQKHDRSRGADPTSILLFCNLPGTQLLHEVQNKKQEKPRAIRSRWSPKPLAAPQSDRTEPDPLRQPSFHLQAHKTAGGAITGEA